MLAFRVPFDTGAGGPGLKRPSERNCFSRQDNNSGNENSEQRYHTAGTNRTLGMRRIAVIQLRSEF